MCKVTISNIATERTYSIRYPSHEGTAGRKRSRNIVKSLKYFVSRHVLEHIGGCHRSELSGTSLEHLTIVALQYAIQTRRVSNGHLFRADVNAISVIAIREQESH